MWLVLLSRSKNKLLLIMLTLLAFMGQTMASSIMSYQMLMTSPQNTQFQKSMQFQRNTSRMDRALHHISSASVGSNLSIDSADQSDCCAKTATCTVMGCSAVALTNLLENNHTLVSSGEKFSNTLFSANSQYAPSLYRPPICSLT